MMNGNIPIIGGKKDSDATVLLKHVLDLSKKGEVTSVAVVLVDGHGGFRVTAAGTDIDGMRDGSVELFQQLESLVEAANKIPPKVLIHDA